jgi:hypothetical protein
MAKLGLANDRVWVRDSLDAAALKVQDMFRKSIVLSFFKLRNGHLAADLPPFQHVGNVMFILALNNRPVKWQAFTGNDGFLAMRRKFRKDKYGFVDFTRRNSVEQLRTAIVHCPLSLGVALSYMQVQRC